jgi:hypothetical protein
MRSKAALSKRSMMSILCFALILTGAFAVELTSPCAAEAADPPPPGLYNCFFIQIRFPGNVTYIPTGNNFALLEGAKYKSLPNSGAIGDYEFNSATEEIKWLTGPLAESRITATYVGLNSTGYTIRLFLDGKPTQICYRKA